MIPLLTGITLLAFAANSLLARLALGGGLIGPWSYTGVRLAAGALTLAILLRPRNGPLPGSWPGAAALAAYAIAFSLAYVALPTGIGALLLFSAVQATMLGYATLRGKPPSPRALAGIALAAAGLIALLAPAPASAQDQININPTAALLMAAAGIAWGIYSLLGRNVSNPAAATAGNFLRTTPLAAIITLAGLAQPGWTWQGAALAALSGAIASGIGYALWYRVLPHLSVTQAGAAQLAVPALAALGGILILGEPATPRTLLAGAVTLAGVGYAVLPRRKK